MTNLYHYEPDRAIDCGELGEGFAEIKARVIYNGPETAQTVLIVYFKITIDVGESKQVIDFIPRLAQNPYLRRKWQDEILADYNRVKESEWEIA